jgi:hypothetical protein
MVALAQTMVLWVMTSCTWIQTFEKSCRLHLQGEGSIGLQNQVAGKVAPETHGEKRNAKFLTLHNSSLKTEAAYFIHTTQP